MLSEKYFQGRLNNALTGRRRREHRERAGSNRLRGRGRGREVRVIERVEKLEARLQFALLAKPAQPERLENTSVGDPVAR